MTAAFLTTIFFSLSVIFANRSIRAVGLTRANLGRLIVALCCLGVYAHTVGGGFGGAGRNWFLLSGLIGMGRGDLASFNALPLLGSRLAILMGQCLAVPFAIVYRPDRILPGADFVAHVSPKRSVVLLSEVRVVPPMA